MSGEEKDPPVFIKSKGALLPYWVGDGEDHELGNFIWGNLTRKEVFLPSWVISGIAIGIIGSKFITDTPQWAKIGELSVAAVCTLPLAVLVGSYIWVADHDHYDRYVPHLHIPAVPKFAYNLIAQGVNGISGIFKRSN